jgi:DNA-binding CsgD family transcriptional regulator
MFELAMVEWYAGNRHESELHLAAVKQAVSDQGESSLDLYIAWGEAISTAGRGQLEQARAQAGQAMEMAERMGDILIGLLPTTVLATLDLWTGRPTSAHELLRSVREPLLATGFGFIGSMTLGLWSLDIEALIACERLDEAQLVLDDLIARARSAKNPNAIAIAERCRGLLLAARRDTTAALKALEAGLTEHSGRPLAPEIARTLLELGTLQRRAKQKTKAKESLERALAMFEQMGAPMWAARARDELARVGLRRPRVSEGLTPAQTRVAELVLAGLSNREIASTLYMSQRSVEAHLTKVYREFGVRTRAQLVASMSAAQATQEIA